jgi:hypothetical protein
VGFFVYHNILSYIQALIIKTNKNMNVLISKILNLDGTWQGYKLQPPHAYAKATWKEPGKQFDSLNEIVEFYGLQNVRELGVKYTYDNKDRKYGIESYEAIL